MLNCSMDVSIIIVNYNTTKLLCQAINSIIQQTSDIEYEIIVIDNSSDENPEQIIKDKYSENVRFFLSKQNIGFGGANNLGIKSAIGRNIFFLNPDTIILNNSIKLLSDFLDQNKTAGIVGGNLYNLEKMPAYSFRRFLPSIFWELNDLLSTLPERIVYGKKSYFNNGTEPLEVGYLTGADIMISREVLNKIKGFDQRFFLFFEETDLSKRIKSLGFSIVNLPDARIVHLEGESFDSKSHRLSFYIESKFTYYRIHFNIFIRIILITIIYLTIITRLILSTLLFRRSKINYWSKHATECRKANKTLWRRTLIKYRSN